MPLVLICAVRLGAASSVPIQTSNLEELHSVFWVQDESFLSSFVRLFEDVVALYTLFIWIYQVSRPMLGLGLFGFILNG